MKSSLDLHDDELEKRARKRAGAKLGWYIHATVYLCVNAVLLALSFMEGRHWAIFPLLGWGLGLAIHGLVVFLATGGAGLHQSLVERERQHLVEQQNKRRGPL